MSALTGALYAALVIYLGGWLKDFWPGNFALLLLTLTFVTFLYWLAERLFFAPRRQKAAAFWRLGAKYRRSASQYAKVNSVRSSSSNAKLPTHLSIIQPPR